MKFHCNEKQYKISEDLQNLDEFFESDAPSSQKMIIFSNFYVRQSSQWVYPITSQFESILIFENHCFSFFAVYDLFSY